MKQLGKQINLYFDKVYGTQKEASEKFKSICRHFDSLFSGFFSSAFELYSQKGWEDFSQNQDFLCYIEHNLFHILMCHFYDGFKMCSLDELSDFLKVFRLLNSSDDIFKHPLKENIDFEDLEDLEDFYEEHPGFYDRFDRNRVIEDLECESYNNYKDARLSFFIPYVNFDTIPVLQALNCEMKISIDLVWDTLYKKTFSKKQKSMPVFPQRNPWSLKEGYWDYLDGSSVDYNEIKKEVSKIVTDDNITAVIDKVTFELLLWDTYNILTYDGNEVFADEPADNIIYDNGSELLSLFATEEDKCSEFLLDDIFGCCADENFKFEHNKSKRAKETSAILTNASEEKRKKYAQKSSDYIMHLLKNEPALLDIESAFEMLFILFNAYYFEKSKNNLLNLLTFGYIYLYMILNDIDAFENIPDNPQKTCRNWKIENSKSVYEIINIICALIDEYLLGI